MWARTYAFFLSLVSLLVRGPDLQFNFIVSELGLFASAGARFPIEIRMLAEVARLRLFT